MSTSQWLCAAAMTIVRIIWVLLASSVSLAGPAFAQGRIKKRRNQVMKANLKVCLCVLAALMAGVAQPAPLDCAGTVTNLYVAADGTVLVIGSWRGDYTRMCNMDQPLQVTTSSPPVMISAITCASWMALLSKAVTNRSTVHVYYLDAQACNALPTYWTAPVPYYVIQAN